MPSTRQHIERRSTANSQNSRPAPSRLQRARNEVNQLFSGRSRVGAPRRSESPESPKEPRQQLGLHGLPSTRINIPYLNRTNTSTPLPSPRSIRSFRNAFTPISSRPVTDQALRRETEQAQVANPPQIRRSSTQNRRFVGVDPAELHLAELAHAGRRRRRQKARNAERGCGPKIKNRKIRSKILSCFISGLFLTLVLTVYLALALSNRNESEEFHVLLILIILTTTIFFCHALIRLCMMIINPPNDDDPPRNLPQMIGPGGYANPPVPIRVALARDEEAAGIESEATKMPPPAYGLWRESVRMDPNRIYWQRNNAPLVPDLERQISSGRPTTANRPPSYISDDGIDYVIDATPRSIAPTTDVPLPPHPSERRG